MPDAHFSPANLDALFALSKVFAVGYFNAKHASWNNARSNNNGNTIHAFVAYPDTHTHFPERIRAQHNRYRAI